MRRVIIVVVALTAGLWSPAPALAQEHGAPAAKPKAPAAEKPAEHAAPGAGEHAKEGAKAAEASKNGDPATSGEKAARREDSAGHESPPARRDPAPRAVRGAELDAVMERINRGINSIRKPAEAKPGAASRDEAGAERPEGSRAATRTDARGHAAKSAAAPPGRVHLEWRQAIVWPAALKPAPASTDPPGRVSLAWASSVN